MSSYILILWFYKGMTSFDVPSLEVCQRIAYEWVNTKRDSNAFCIHKETGKIGVF